MSYEDGWAAINLEMPRRVPRTEYSAEEHWDLIKVVTGIDVSVDSPPSLQSEASLAFMRAWDYDLFWSTLIDSRHFGEVRTYMGHGEYAAGGVDFSAVVTCPFHDPEDVLNFDPWESLGERNNKKLVHCFEEHYKNGCQKRPFGVNMTGTYVSLISGLIDLFGWEMLLMAAALDSRRFGEVANRYASWMQQYYDALAETNVPVVMIHDDIVWASGPFLRPAWYREYIFPNYRKYLAPLLATGKKVIYTSDGNYTAFIDDIAAVGVHGFVLEPLTDLAYVVGKYGKTHVIIGNADTRVLLSGSEEEIRAEVVRCMSLGRKCPGFFLAVGNHIPPNTPVEAALYYNRVYEELCWR